MPQSYYRFSSYYRHELKQSAVPLVKQYCYRRESELRSIIVRFHIEYTYIVDTLTVTSVNHFSRQHLQTYAKY